MAGNTDALRFYARRGLVPGEVLLYRFPRRASEDAPAGLSSRPRQGAIRDVDARGGTRTRMPRRAAGFKPAVSDQFHHPGGAKSNVTFLTPC